MKISHSICTGCEACSNRCPVSCINMILDSEGFRYPKIDKDICKDCGLCEKVCPVLISPPKKTKSLSFYLAINKDEKIRRDSSSGGIFHLLAENIIGKEGYVYAAKYDQDFNVVHSKINTIKDIDIFRNSKYVQSHIGFVYKNIEAELKLGKTILFVGTPCQVAGLKSFLKKEYPQLITVDFICHGVPSVKVFHSYLDFLNIKDISSFKINMRDKSEGWNGFGVKYSVGNKYTFENRYKNPYMKGFLADLYLRPSCYNCNFKDFSSGSDITLADAWCVGDYYPEWNDEKGTSTVILKTEKGKILFDSLKDIKLLRIKDEIIKKHNRAAYESAKPHKNRSKFFQMLNSEKYTFGEIINKCLPEPTYINKLIWSINKRILISINIIRDRIIML